MADPDDAPSRLDWKRAVRESDLPPPSKLLCFVLESRMSAASPRPFPSVGSLVSDTGLGRSTVLKHLKIITEEHGELVQKRERSDGAGRRTSNEYRLVLPTEGGRVQEIDPGVQQMDGGGSSSETPGGPASGPGSSKKKKKEEEDARVVRVWEHYVSRYAQRYSPQRAERLKLTAAGRDGKIRGRLREGYTEEDLCTAIDGNFADDWHRERDKHELEYIFRNQSKVEGFLSRAERNGGPPEGDEGAGRDVLDAYDGGTS